MSNSAAFLFDRADSRLVKATFVDDISAKQLDDYLKHWKTFARRIRGEHGHWNWPEKVAHYSQELQYQFAAIECEGVTQGLMIVNTISRCRLPEQANKHLVYIEYLETAPWNQRALTDTPRFKGVGSLLVRAAVQLSLDEENGGRIGLHSLPQADSFYAGECGMTDLGQDPLYPKVALKYFEMTESQAAAFLNEGE